MPLRLRLTAAFGIATCVILAVAGFVFFVQLRASLDASLDTSLRTRSDALTGRLVTTSPALPVDVTTSVSSSEQVSQILDASGAVFASSRGAGSRSLLDGDERRRAARGPIFLTKDITQERTRLLASPVVAGGKQYISVVSQTTDITDNAIVHIGIVMAVGGLPAVALAMAGAWLLAGAALRPVERMRREVADISEHDATARLAVPTTRDEIAALAVTMNGLLTRLQGALARERGFVADAGHELRTPLTILKAELELAGKPGRSRDDLTEAVANAAEETDRLVRLAEDLLLLARADEGAATLRLAPMSLADTLRAAVRARSVSDRITLRLPAPDGLDVVGDADRLRQVIDNLLDNAVRHSPPGGGVEVVATLDGLAGAPGGVVRVEILDDGPGFPPGFLPHAFERFRRADTARARDDGGTGLGLAIVRSLVRAHGGRVSARNRDEGGAAVRFELPLVVHSMAG